MIPDQAQVTLNWLLRSSFQASVLVVLVLITQFVLGPKLPARWRHALWWLVILKLLIPILPASSLSVFNLLPHPPILPPSPASTWNTSLVPPLYFSIASLWLFGVALTAVLILREHRRLAAAVIRQRPVTDPAVLDILEDCKALMRIYTPLAVIETPKVPCPALFGFVRPRLLLPRGTIHALSPVELRHVFLHELAHLQRHDIAVGWLLALAQSLHWFNPIVWYALHHVRADRELATDELALHHAQLKEQRPYAETIIKLLDQFSRPAPIPAIVGILEDQRQMARRIRHIARFGSTTKWHAIPLAILLLLALVSLPDAPQIDNSIVPIPHNLTTPSLAP